NVCCNSPGSLSLTFLRWGSQETLFASTVQDNAWPLLPRVLLLSDEGPNLNTAGGILLYRLFHGFPVDRLFVVAGRLDPTHQRLACPHRLLETPWQRLERSRFHRLKRSLRALGLVPPVT